MKTEAVAQLILAMYEWIRRGKSFSEIRRMADKKIAGKLENAI